MGCQAVYGCLGGWQHHLAVSSRITARLDFLVFVYFLTDNHKASVTTREAVEEVRRHECAGKALLYICFDKSKLHLRMQGRSEQEDSLVSEVRIN